jgi:hypothetical protein
MTTILKITAGILLAWVIGLVSVFIIAGVLSSGVSNKTKQVTNQLTEQVTNQLIPTQSIDLTNVDDLINQFAVPVEEAMQQTEQPVIVEQPVAPVLSEYDRIKLEYCNSLDSYIDKHHCLWTSGRYESMQKQNN